jgi:hypothetical protein
MTIYQEAEGTGKRASLFAGPLLGGGLLPGDLEGHHGEVAQGTDIILCGGPTGEFCRGFIYRALRRLWRRVPFSIGALLNIRGGSVHREF